MKERKEKPVRSIGEAEGSTLGFLEVTRWNRKAKWRSRVLRPIHVTLADGRVFRFDTHQEAELAKRDRYQSVETREEWLRRQLSNFDSSTPDRDYFNIWTGQVPVTDPVRVIGLPKGAGKTVAVTAGRVPKHPLDPLLRGGVSEEILNQQTNLDVSECYPKQG